MGYMSSTKGLWLFNRTLDDEVSSNSFGRLDTTADTFASFQRLNLFTGTLETKYGLQINAGDPGYEGPSGLNLKRDGVHDFAISFWWYSPAAVGYIRHAITRNLESRVTPIIAKASSNMTRSFQRVRSGEIIISEVAASATQNAIKVEICANSSHPTNSYISEAYNPGLKHVYVYFKIVSGASKLRIFINGKAGDVMSGPEADNMQNTNTPIYLNYIYHGYSSHKTTQSGSFLSQLIIRNTTDDAEQDALKSYRFGVNTISQDTYENINYDFWGTGYHQPSTTTTNQIYAIGGNIYLARSNGEILKGTQPIWDTEFNYLRNDDLQLLAASDMSKVSRSPNGLTINGTTVRI